MPTTDPRIDAYIENAAPFAQPILVHLRGLIHRALPDCEEGIKWGMPHFMVGGKNVSGMSAFKAHCAFVVHGEGMQGKDEGMGAYGKIASLGDLPGDDALVDKVKADCQRQRQAEGRESAEAGNSHARGFRRGAGGLTCGGSGDAGVRAFSPPRIS